MPPKKLSVLVAMHLIDVSEFDVDVCDGSVVKAQNVQYNWGAQIIEYDFATQAESLAALRVALQELIMLALQDPSATCAPAPVALRERFEAAPVRLVYLGEALVPDVELDIRIIA